MKRIRIHYVVSVLNPDVIIKNLTFSISMFAIRLDREICSQDLCSFRIHGKLRSAILSIDVVFQTYNFLLQFPQFDVILLVFRELFRYNLYTWLLRHYDTSWARFWFVDQVIGH